MTFASLAFGAGWGDEILAGLAVTVGLAAASFVVGTALGLAGALALLGRNRIIAAFVAGWNALFRSLPELLVVFVIYYGLSLAIRGVLAPFGVTGFFSLGSFATGVVAISLIHGAYASEVFRGAFRAVPAGPVEAARALGLRSRQGFFLVTLPLALRYALPGLVNLSVVTLKITPLVSAIGLQDLIRTAGDAGKNTKDYLAFYLIALALYLVVAAALYLLQLRLERRLDQQHGTA